MLELLDDASSSPEMPEELRGMSRYGRFLVGGMGLATFGLLCLAGPFVAPAMRSHCLPYVSATDVQIRLLLSARTRQAGKLVDLGSGDGCVVIAAAKQGIPAVGYELNYWLVLYSRWAAWRAGVHRLARFHCADLWSVDLRPYDTIVVFGVADMMVDLEKKLARDMKEDAEVLAGRFGLKTWTPKFQILDPLGNKGLNNIFVYDKQPAPV